MVERWPLVVQKTQVVLLDDVDGSDADETVTFALDGVSYEIDVTSAHAAELRAAMASWVGHARRTGGRSIVSARSAGRRAPIDRSQLVKVREWARGAGYKVSDRGRISAEIMAAFQAAH
jgi:hypothetical protein